MQNSLFTQFNEAYCRNHNLDGWEQMLILPTEDGKCVIQSRFNGKNLQVQPNGRCVFANHNKDLWEKFEIEMNEEGGLFLVSCHTGNVLQCSDNGVVWCANTNRQGWEQWTIVYPPNTNIPTSGSIWRTIATVAGVIVGAIVIVGVLVVAALFSGGLVPVAMSAFGTVIAGVGVARQRGKRYM